MTPILIAIIVCALAFDLLNGIHDSSNIVATMIASRAFSPRVALGVTALAEFSGPFIFGVAVAETIGNEIVLPGAINTQIILAALLAAIAWNLITWYLGFPSSSSHALIGGFMGSVIMGAGWEAIRLQGIEKVLIALFTSPIIGFIFGMLITRVILTLSITATPRVNGLFKRGQILSAIVLALSHGANDAQKTMGIIAMALLAGGIIDNFYVPLWVIVLCASMISIGTAFGGWKLIKTLGAKFFRIRPIDGFSSQLASAIVIITNSLLGGPVSTTQVVSSAIMGTGAADRWNKVRWGVAKDILIAWLLTIPFSALVASGFYKLIILLIPLAP